MICSVVCSEVAANIVRPTFPKRAIRNQECFVVLALDSKHIPIGRPTMVAMGTVNSVEVHPRDVFRVAVKKNAVAIIVAHNHPSGALNPSPDDKILTSRLKAAGELLGIPLIDHIIINGNSHISLADHGEL